MPAVNPNGSGAYRPPKPKPKPKRTVRVKAHPHVEVHVHVHPSPDAQDAARAVVRRNAPAHPSPDAQDVTRSPAMKRRDKQAVARNVKDSRRKVVVRNRQKAVRGILTGTGPIVAANQKVAKKITPTIAAQIPATHIPGIGKLLKRTVEDFANAPAQVVPSVYVPAAGAYEAAKGRPQRINKFRHDVAKTDPFYNLGAAGVAKVRGQDKQAKLHLGRTKKSLSEHPGFAALEAYGLKGALGRGAGRVMRSGVAGKRAKRAASTVRAPKVQPGTSLRVEQRYSPDVIRKAEQVNRERRLRRQSQQTAARAKAETNPERRAELEQKARGQNPGLMQERDIVGRVDKNVAAMEAVRRRHRAQTVNETRKLVKPVRKAGPITSLVTQRITDATLPDLRSYLAELEAEHPNLGKVAQKANVTMRHHLAKAIRAAEKGKVNLADVQRVADEYAARNVKASRGLVTRGMLDAEQAERRVVMPYAVRKMGAEHTGNSLTLRRKVIRSTVRTEKAEPLPSREEFIAKRPKADPRDTPDFEGATRTLREVGKPGLDIERDYKRYGARDGGGLSDELVPGSDRKVVARGPDGRVQGVLHVFFGPDGKPDLLQVVVAPEHRGKGIATALYKRAEKEGWDVEAASGKGGLTEAGAGFAYKRKSAKGDRRVFTRTVTEEDTPLSTAAIKAHMRRHGAEPGAYINQGPNQRSAGNFYRSSHQPPKIASGQFTGKATKGGTFSAHPDTLVEASARTQTLKDQFDHFQKFVQEFAHKNPKGRGGYLTRRSRIGAQKLADELTLAHGIKWQVVRANPLGGSKEQLRAMLEGDASKPNTVTDAIQEALDGKGAQGPWAIVPEAAAKRMQEHVRLMAPGNAGRVARHASSLFRQSVLATSPKWFVNNAVEAGFRSAFARAGPRSYMTGRRYLREVARIDPKNAEYVQARTVGGGHYAMAERQRIHMDTEQFTDGAIKDVARHMSAFWRLPGAHHAADLWNGWTHFVFNTANAYIEHQFQTGMLGKAVRDQLMPGELRKLSEKAIREAATGHHDTNTVVALGDAVDRMYGKYDKFTPGMKQAIALYTPFVAWSLNAAYFVLRTLPQDHPTALALIASTERATEDWRKQHGLDEFVKGRVPGFLQGSVPGPNNTKYRAPTNSLPFGAFSDVPNTAASAVLPQLSGVLSSFEGRDWKGKELRDKHGNPLPETQKALTAASEFMQSTIPALAVKQQVQKGVSGQVKSITGFTKPPKKKAAKGSAAAYHAPKIRLGGGSAGTSGGAKLNSERTGSSAVRLNSGG